MSPAPLRLAVIGAGVMGASHIERIRADGDSVLAAVCDPDRSRARRAAGGACPAYAGLPELLRRERIDGAIVAAPTAEHRACGALCVESGVPVLMEKPIAATAADGAALVAAADARGVPLLVGQHRRHSAYVRRAKQAVDRGQIGRLLCFTALWFVRKPDDYYAAGWRTRPGGGPVLTNLIHEIDLMRHLGGEIDSVYAAAGSPARGLPVEDTVAVTLRLRGGALGSIAASDAAVSPWSYELTTHENPLYTRTGGNCYFLLGTAGSLAFPRLTVWRHPGAAGWQHPLARTELPVEPNDPVAAQLAHFCRVIRGREAPLVPGADGLATLAAAEAVLQSAREGRPVAPAAAG